MRQIYQTPMLTPLRSPANGGLVTKSASTSPAQSRKTSPSVSPNVSTKPSFANRYAESNHPTLTRVESVKVPCIVKTIEALAAAEANDIATGSNLSPRVSLRKSEPHSGNNIASRVSLRVTAPLPTIVSEDGSVEEVGNRKSKGESKGKHTVAVGQDVAQLGVPRLSSDDSFVTAPESGTDANANDLRELESDFVFTSVEVDAITVDAGVANTIKHALNSESDEGATAKSVLAHEAVVSFEQCEVPASSVTSSICAYNRNSLSSGEPPSDQTLKQEILEETTSSEKADNTQFSVEAPESSSANIEESPCGSPVDFNTDSIEVEDQTIEVEPETERNGIQDPEESTEISQSSPDFAETFPEDSTNEEVAYNDNEVENNSVQQDVDKGDVTQIAFSPEKKFELESPTQTKTSVWDVAGLSVTEDESQTPANPEEQHTNNLKNPGKDEKLTIASSPEPKLDDPEKEEFDLESESTFESTSKSSTCNEAQSTTSGVEYRPAVEHRSAEKTPLRAQVSSIVDSLFESVSCEMLAQQQAEDAKKAASELAQAEVEAQNQTQEIQSTQQKDCSAAADSSNSKSDSLFPLDMPPRRLSKVQRMLGEEAPEGGPTSLVIDMSSPLIKKAAIANALSAKTSTTSSHTSTTPEEKVRCTRQSTEERFKPPLVHKNSDLDGMLIIISGGKGKHEYTPPPKRKESTEEQQLKLHGPGERTEPVSADEARRMQIYGTLPMKGRRSKDCMADKGENSKQTRSPLCKEDSSASIIGDLRPGNYNPRIPGGHAVGEHRQGGSKRTRSNPNTPVLARRTASAEGSDLIPNISNHTKLSGSHCISASVPNLSEEPSVRPRGLQGRKGVASEELLSIVSVTSGHPLRKHCHKRSVSQSNGTQSNGASPLTPNKHSQSHINSASNMSLNGNFNGRGSTLRNMSSSGSRRRASSGSVSRGSMCSGMSRHTLSQTPKLDHPQMDSRQGSGVNWTGTLSKGNGKHLGQELTIFGVEHVFSNSRSYRVCHTAGRGTVARGAGSSTSTLPRRGANMKDVQDFRSVESGRLMYRMGVSVNASTPQTVLMDSKGDPITRLRKQHKFMGMTPTVYVEDIRPVAINGRMAVTGKQTSLAKQKGVRVLTCTKSITINDTLKEGECINVFFCNTKEKERERELAELVSGNAISEHQTKQEKKQNKTKVKALKSLAGKKKVSKQPDITIEGDVITPRYIIFNSDRDILARAVPDLDHGTYQVQIAPGVDHVVMLNLVMSLNTLK